VSPEIPFNARSKNLGSWLLTIAEIRCYMRLAFARAAQQRGWCALVLLRLAEQSIRRSRVIGCCYAGTAVRMILAAYPANPKAESSI